MELEAWNLVVAITTLVVGAVAVIIATRPSLTVGSWEYAGSGSYQVDLGNTGRGGAKHARVILVDRSGKRVAESAGEGEVLYREQKVTIPMTLHTDPQFPLKIVMEHEWFGIVWKPKSKVSISAPSATAASAGSASSSSTISKEASEPHTGSAPPEPALPISTATAEDVWQRLGEHHVRGMLRGWTWENLVDRFRDRGGPCDVVTPADWYSVPEEDNSCRIAAVATGTSISIRWANDRAFETCGLSPNHANLLEPGEDNNRTGYVHRKADVIVITP